MKATITLKTFRILMIAGLIVGSLMMMTGCSDEDDLIIPQTDNPYAGSWMVVFDDFVTGVGTFDIGTDGKSSLKMTFTDGNSFASYTVSFEVDHNGRMSSGKIHDPVSQVGTIGGQFSGDSGVGTFTASQPASGAWVAGRKSGTSL